MSVPVARAAIATADTYSVAATTSDPSGVTWSIAPASGTPASNAGTFNPATTANGAAAVYTPKGAGTFTVTATSVTNTAVSAAFTLYVTDLAGVLTYHNDLNRDGANTQEYALVPQNVQSHFGKLFSCPVDGAIYAQPLWVAGVTIAGAKHNVVYVATEHDGLWAFDADANPCQKLWSVSLIDQAHGGNAGETSVPAGQTGSTEGFLVGLGNGDMAPEVGVTGTPVIAPGATAGTGTLYVVSKSVSADGKSFYQRLHAIDITTGAEVASPTSPVVITASSQGTGDNSTTDQFNAQVQNQRAGLALVNGTVYVSWASHEDSGHYYGWVIGYNTATLQQSFVFNDAPNNKSANGHGAGIWMSGGAPAADSAGNLYLITGNGPFDANSAAAPNNDYGDSLLKLAATNGNLSVADYFTPSDQADDDAGDNDFGSGGAAILADLPSPVTINGVAVTHLIVGGDEKGRLYLLNRDKLGGFTANNAGAIQPPITAGTELSGVPANGSIFATGAYWNGMFYIIANGQTPQLQAYQMSPSTAQLSLTSKVAGFGYPSGTPSVSAQGATNGVLWALDDTPYCTPESTACGPAVLHAYDATNLTELYNSSKVATDAAGYPVKFTVPTVANGKVYVGTRGNNRGGPDTTPGPSNAPAVPGELDVYGLLPN